MQTILPIIREGVDIWEINIVVAGMLALEIQATGSKYVKNIHFDTDSRHPIGVDNICSG